MRFSQVLVLVVALSEGADVQPSCGRVSGSVGGQDIPPGRWPWFADLYYKQNFLCFGSLISDQWLLSSSNCLRGANISAFTVVLGRTNQTGSNPNEVSRGINQTVCHPLFNQETYENDICLAKLSSPVELSDHISPVCLAAANSTFPNGTFSWIVGPLFYGNEELTALQLQILGNDECRNHSYFTMTDNKICTRYDPLQEHPCLITTGAPLLIRNNDLVWIQLGISTIGLICRKNTLSPVFTRVSRYQEWIIQSVTGSSQPGFATFPSAGGGGVSASTSSPPGPITTLPIELPWQTTNHTVVPPTPDTTPTMVPPRTTCDRSIFGSGEQLSSTVLPSVFALLFSLVFLVV